MQAKLDELLRANEGARSALTRLNEQEPEDIQRHRNDEHRKPTDSHRMNLPNRSGQNLFFRYREVGKCHDDRL